MLHFTTETTLLASKEPFLVRAIEKQANHYFKVHLKKTHFWVFLYLTATQKLAALIFKSEQAHTDRPTY